jgi:hypothetical protein
VWKSLYHPLRAMVEGFCLVVLASSLPFDENDETLHRKQTMGPPALAGGSPNQGSWRDIVGTRSKSRS